jgi:DNA polymerase-3 subunit delta'
MIIDHQHIQNYLKNSIENKRISHAYLFEGSEHSEKRTMALWFAKLLGCTGPDITEITVPQDKKEIRIEQIRELRRYLSLSPHSSPYKVAIINEAEKMTDEAANALLKTLEEPRGNAVLILMTTLASALPETILSRCEEIKFRTGSLDKISKNFIKKESIDILKQPLNDAFKFIEKITKKEDDEILALLDSWLFWFRDLLLKDKKTKYSQEQLVKIIREIQRAKDLISNTNTNQRLALENLVLEIYV